MSAAVRRSPADGSGHRAQAGGRPGVTAVLALMLALAGCASSPSAPDPATRVDAATPARDPDARASAEGKPPPPRPAARRGGAFYLDDGPGGSPPVNLASIPDAEPRIEPLHRFANRPYVVFGRQYTPMTERTLYKARGMATWYGTRYHSKQTSSGEVYDMYSMTGAHPTLPIPSYVRVTHVGNGRSAIIRINDRGPFIGDRLIDLSYAAAFRLGYIENGSALVEVEKLIPGVNWPASGATLVAGATSGAKSGAKSVTRSGATPVPQPAAPPVSPAATSATVTSATAGFATAASATVTSATATVVTTPLETVKLPAALPLTAEANGIFLQLGAFSDRGNAETFLARVGPELGELGRTAHVFVGKGLFRVHIGPYPDERQARATAEQLLRELSIKPVLTVR